jgi:hypothetical protein
MGIFVFNMIIVFFIPLLILAILIYGYFKNLFHPIETMNLNNMASIYFHIDYEKKSFYWCLLVVL